MVTGEQVKAAMMAANISIVNHHECSICNQMVFYVRNGEQLFFAPGCGCSWSPAEPVSWERAADFINMQTNIEIRNKLRAAFGLLMRGLI